MFHVKHGQRVKHAKHIRYIHKKFLFYVDIIKIYGMMYM